MTANDPDVAVWTGREPCLDPRNNRDWWSAEPMPEDSGEKRKAKKAQRAHALNLCQDCPHSSWLLCARKALEGEGTKASPFGVWAGVWVDSARNTRKKCVREEAIAQLKAIAATGVYIPVEVVVKPGPKPKPVVVRMPRRFMGRQRVLNETQIATAHHMHDQGSSYVTIGAALGCSQATAWRALNRKGVA
jgi:hypothetical protein